MNTYTFFWLFTSFWWLRILPQIHCIHFYIGMYFHFSWTHSMKWNCSVISNKFLSLCQTIFQNGSSILYSYLRVSSLLVVILIKTSSWLWSDMSWWSWLIFPDGLPSYTEHILMYLLVTCVSSLENCLFKFFTCFSSRLFVFVLSSCRSPLYIMDISSSSDMIHKYSLPFYWFSFPYLGSIILGKKGALQFVMCLISLWTVHLWYHCLRTIKTDNFSEIFMTFCLSSLSLVSNFMCSVRRDSFILLYMNN